MQITLQEVIDMIDILISIEQEEMMQSNTAQEETMQSNAAQEEMMQSNAA